MRKIKLFIILISILLLCSSVVSAGLWDWVTGKVTSESSVTDVLNEGEIKTYTINGIDYEVALDYVNPTSAKFNVNGEPTSLISVDDSYKLVDGTGISVNSIVYQDFAEGVKKAEFILSDYEEKQCTDSDDGKDYYVKGVAFGPNDNSIYNNVDLTDNCYGPNDALTEFYCENGQTTYDYYECPNGCEDGACIKSSTTTKPNQPIDLSNYPKMFIKDNKFNGYLVVGDKASADNVIALSEIAASLQFEGTKTTAGTIEITRIDVGTTKLASQIDNPYNSNIISIGPPCSSAVSSQLMGNPVDCTKGFTKGKGSIKLYNYNGYAQIVVAGYSDDDTRKTAKVLANWQDYDLKGSEICVYGTFSNPYIKDCGQETIETKCTDSDGGINYYVKGYVEMIGDSTFGTSGRKYDICWNDGKHLSEYVCENGVYKGDHSYICPQGCKDGACVQDFPEITTTFIAAVYDRGPATDVIILSDTIVALKGMGHDIPIGTSKLFSEVNALWLDNKVTLAIYLGEAVIIVGEHSPASHVAVDIKELLSKKGITPQTILSSEVSSANLLDLFEEEFDEEDEDDEEDEEISVRPPTKVEKDRCKTNKDCNDDNACTSDLCSGTPKICSNMEVGFGCNYKENCVPIGVRVSNNYCDIDRTIKSQLDANEDCSNNYECSSNMCVNDKCISQSLIQKIMNWFSRFFGG